MKVFVYIATTQGPVLVRKITQEDDDVQSVVCLNHTADRLPISSRYHEFVKKGTGLVHHDFGHGAFRMDLSGRVTAGDSWQLGVYIAHAMSSSGLLLDLASSDDAQPGVDDLVIWATGAVRADRSVSSVEEIPQKLAQSADLFAHCLQQRVPLMLLVPAENLATARAVLEAGDYPTLNMLTGAVDAAGVQAHIDARLPAEYQAAAAATAPSRPGDTSGSEEALANDTAKTQQPVAQNKDKFWATVVLLLIVGATAIWYQSQSSRQSSADVELDDFGSQPADPKALEMRLPEAISAEPMVSLSSQVKLLGASLTLQLSRGDDEACEASSTESVPLGQGDPLFTTIRRKGLCAWSIDFSSSDYAFYAVAIDGARLLPVREVPNGQAKQLPLPSVSNTPRDVLLILVPDEDAPDFADRLTRELRRLRFAEFDRELAQQTLASVQRMTAGYASAGVRLLP